MRIKLRPYHPSYVISFYARGTECTGMNGKGFNYVIENIRNNPDNIEIELVQEYDDICNRCNKKKENADGSIWGKDHTCPSAEDSGIVERVKEANKEVLSSLGLDFGSVIRLKDLVKLMSEKMSILKHKDTGPEYQDFYEKGLKGIISS